MAKYIIDEATLVSFADKVRALSGEAGGLTTAQMESLIGEALTDIETQEGLINQIKNALQGKAAGGGGGQYEVWTITYVDGTVEEKGVTVYD